jgi:hypothetical protein
VLNANALKKVFSILFVTLLLLNTMGYYFVFLGLQYSNDVKMARQLNAVTYEASHAVVIKIPVAVPYMADQTDFERVDGKFEHRGEFYRLVKQKYAQDTLTVICIKDQENKRIHNALSNYLANFTAESAGLPGNDIQVPITFIKDYVQHQLILTKSHCWQADLIQAFADNDLFPTYTASIIHPPERA